MFTRYGLIATVLILMAAASAFWLGAGGPISTARIDTAKPAARQPPGANQGRDQQRRDNLPIPPPIAKALAAPSFDIVKVAPDGQAVIAGKAEPGAKITLLDNGKVIGNTKADDRGEWVILPDKPLNAGTRELALHADTPGQKTQVGEQLVVINVPEQKDGGPAKSVAVALPIPGSNQGGTTAVLRLPEGAQAARSGMLEVVTLEYDTAGKVTVIGKGPANASVLAYIDNAPLGSGAADLQGAWRIDGTMLLAEGAHRLRVDLLDNAGAVGARLELPLQRDTIVVAGGKAPQGAGGGTVTIVRGHNLWQIAQRNYGAGQRFTVIYEANRGQIRDPNLIYPGQIFVLPKPR